MNRFVLSEIALRDLNQIYDYIVERNPKAANDMLDQFENAFQLLAQSPGIGHVRTDLTQQNVRFWPVHSCLVIYQETNPLRIVRILSGFQDIIRML